ncbi:LysM peptidoglycan-binding domain-containing protein [Pontibacter sp. HSC-36F09]|uniref:LysM peptidoglycan-binding domain-containing protein n=1 Tax=Pontibacter sp. HSC-36F09 TaxID=2910966 RepID=UPI00209CBA67|nr:LysM peptidoglycan-binding domain-containing protein [Pontibacter sp. HSC-36F09]MCP2042310.1 membrane-bound lytic murein transglycosylase D [Pontibacter sp. HSC-36F09]
MKTPLPFLLLLLLPLFAVAQTVTVPHNLYFGDIHLRISPRAQEEIQKKVDALHRSPKFFQMKVELADAYFPLIERTFQEEGVPDDFKYLALQESGLRGDAVSTSNAVGYWQFKKEAALDFNLRMDHLVDERRHIIEASRGAARYFKRSNNFYNNWFNALLSYYHGYSGAKAYTKESDKGSKRMDITEKSDPYLLTFLAHKVAYDSFIGKSAPPVVSLRELRATPGQSLADIALAYQTDPSELEKYNKWLLGSTIPADKDYYVMLPVRHTSEPGIVASTEPVRTTPVRQTAAIPAAGSIIKRNNLNAIVAGKGDTKDKLAIKAGITTRKLLRFNDMRDFDKFEEGEAYYIEAKRLNADKEYHVVQHGETMQEIAQQYGIRMDYLQFKNRMKRAEVPVPGRVLWLQKRRPAKVAIEVRELKPIPGAEKQNVIAQEKAPQTVTTSAKTTAAEPAAQQDNFLTRLKKSWNKLKGQAVEPEQEETQTTATTTKQEEETTTVIPAKEAEQGIAKEETTVEEEPVKVAVATKNETAPIPVIKQPEQEVKATEPIVAQKAATPAATEKPKNAALYPGKKAQETEEQKTVTQEKQVEETEEENAEWAVGLSEDVFVGFSGNEEEETAEVLEAEKTVETAATEHVTVKKTPAKAEPAKSKPARQESAKTSQSSTVAKENVAPLAKPARHIVKQGESLWGISRLYAVTVNDITTWNNLGDAPIKIGQELIIAEPQTVPEESAPNVEANTEASVAAAKTEIHTVAAGESLYVLSRRYNVTVNELKAWNNLRSSALSIGQELRVTAPADQKATNEDLEEAPSETFTGSSTQHTVASGESLYQISRKYGVTIKDIMEWNNKSDFNVKPGDKLVIRKK